MQPYEQLEEEFAQWAGCPHMVVCNSGTSALHLALETLGVPAGSEVLVPDFTMIACARAVTLAGLKPVFVDCDDYGLMDYKLVDRAIYGSTEEECRSNNVVGIMAVHVYGRRCNMDSIAYSARHANCFVVEDLAEAHGVEPHKDTSAACWSFYKNKVVAGEEGGAVAFHHRFLANKARSLRTLGFTEDHDFTHIPRGHNYRLANSLAKLILNSLRSYRENMVVRNAIKDTYDKLCPKEWLLPHRHVPWVYDLRIPGLTKEQQDKIVLKLQVAGIPARHAFKPLSSQEEYRDCRLVTGKVHKAEILSRETIYLPIEPMVMHQSTVEHYMKSLLEVVRAVLG
jgi:dTDP-4-amino-4,6-dideoxygalactose transaminase